MFERFTDRARKVYQLAHQFACSRGYEAVDVEHLFMGLLKEGSGIGVHALKNLGVDVDLVRCALNAAVVQKGVEDSKVLHVGKLQHTIGVKAVSASAIEWAQKLSNNYVGTEHILLGLLSVPFAFGMLLPNMTADKVEAEIKSMLGNSDHGASVPLDEAFKLLAALPAGTKKSLFDAKTQQKWMAQALLLLPKDELAALGLQPLTADEPKISKAEGGPRPVSPMMPAMFTNTEINALARNPEALIVLAQWHEKHGAKERIDPDVFDSAVRAKWLRMKAEEIWDSSKDGGESCG